VVDEIHLGYALAIITIAAPMLIYLMLSSWPLATAFDTTSGPSDLERNKGMETLEIIHVMQSMHNKLSNIDYEHNNPEQVLHMAYEQQALSEVDRCLGSGNYKNLCDNTMGLLIESCTDSNMHVAACDDPRLTQYKALVE
jgi:hypothetical protein